MVLENYMHNPYGLLALLALIPFIILYLIRPKPKDKIIPSLMFLLAKERRMKENSFLRKLINNLLFILQFLILLLLGVSVASPFFNIEYDVSAEDTVIVLDVSASMQTKKDSKTRFEEAKELTEDYLGGKNTIVLASDRPEILIKDGAYITTLQLLKSTKAKDTTTNLGDAMAFAAEQLTGKRGRVVVISDFINSETDPITTKRTLESKNVKVEFVDVSGKAENTGIIDLIIGEKETVIYIKNYDDIEKEVNIELGNTKKSISIGANSVEILSFATPEKNAEIEIKPNDDFNVDNKVYISIPKDKKIKILYVTNAELGNLFHALSASPKNIVEVVNPPIVPNVEHDVYIIDRIDKTLILPETIREISEDVRTKSASLIIVMQEDITDIDFLGMLPIEKTLMEERRSTIKVEQINSFTEDIEFGYTSNYLKSEPKDDIVVIVSDGSSPLITYNKLETGNIIYYGINDKTSDFKLSPTYPIFWDNLLQFLVDRDSIKSLNFKVDNTVSGKKFDKTGFHNLGTKEVAINLLSDKESDVGKESNVVREETEVDKERFKTTRPVNIETHLISLGLLLLFLELFYIKYRGDL